MLLSVLGMTSQKLKELDLIKPEGVLHICQEALKRVDPRLINHGERVAFIVFEMMEYAGCYSRSQMIELYQLAVFHDIGAYKIEEITQMLKLESAEEMEHSLYGYLFLHNMSPVAASAEAVLYHHHNYNELGYLDDKMRGYAQLIHLADRVDILAGNGEVSFGYLRGLGGTVFDPELVELFISAERKRNILARVRNGEYRIVTEGVGVELCSDTDTAVEYLTMMVYLIDFKSSATVDHTINVLAFAVLLARLMGLPEREQYCVYLGALLHDLGKMAIPYEILESPGRLSPQEMAVMKSHVVITDEILRGNISDYIRRIAVRHHEKPDGSGYPGQLTDADVTLSEKIMAVADVMSALLGQRSYKEGYSREKTIGIIEKMAETGKLDREICQVATQNFDYMTEVAGRNCAPILAAYHKFSDDYTLLKQTFV